EEFEDETGIDPEAVVTKGDNRITAAMAMIIDTSSDKWELKYQSLNGEVLMASSSLFFLARAFSSKVEVTEPQRIPTAIPAIPAVSPGGGTSTGVAACDAYFKKIDSCSGLPASSKKTMLEQKDTIR